MRDLKAAFRQVMWVPNLRAHPYEFIVAGVAASALKILRDKEAPVHGKRPCEDWGATDARLISVVCVKDKASAACS